MGHEPRIRICFQRGKRANLGRAGGVKRVLEVLDIGGQGRDVLVLCRDDDQGPPQVLPEAGDEQRAGAAGETGDDDVAFVSQGFRDDAAEVCGGGDPRQHRGDMLFGLFMKDFHDAVRAR